MDNTLEQQIRQIVRDEIAKGKIVFNRPMQILDGNNIVIGKTNGTSIGTATTQKLSVYGVTPLAQQSAPHVPSGGATIDSEARSAIADLTAIIKNFGISA